MHVKGCLCAVRTDNSNAPTAKALAAAVEAAKGCDLIVFASGIDATLEQEEAGPNHPDFAGFYRGDRTKIELPAHQTEWIKALAATGKPTVVVNCSGSAMSMPWEVEHVPAIVQAWYPGEEGGAAVAQVLFGDVNPAGRLPVTVYASTEDLPAIENYLMANRTYRYFTGKPQYAFGHGLSYTQFNYADARLSEESISATGTIELSLTLSNVGSRNCDEVAQIYAARKDAAAGDAKLTLCGFQRITRAAGKQRAVSLEIPAARLRQWDEAANGYVVRPGEYQLLIGKRFRRHPSASYDHPPIKSTSIKPQPRSRHT